MKYSKQSIKCIGGTLPHPQSGRTLLEILAVLAIIGVLSVTALSTLTEAFAKHKANDTLQDVHLWALTATDSPLLPTLPVGQKLALPELPSVSTHGYPISVQGEDENVFSIRLLNIPKRVCRQILKINPPNMLIAVNGEKYTETDLCRHSTENMSFYFDRQMGNIANICLEDCGNGICLNGSCCYEEPCNTQCGCKDGFCIQNTMCCPNATDKLCNGQICCNTAKGLTCRDNQCQCMDGRTFNAETGICDCPAGTFPFNEQELCCASGYTPFNGTCQKITCTGGPSLFQCSLNNIRCGTNCDSTGRQCARGICYADECPAGYPFERLKNNNWWGGGEKFGCAIKDTDCYTSPNFTACWQPSAVDKTPCCFADLSGECIDGGICDPSVCKAFETETLSAIYSGNYCIFNDETNGISNIYCTHNSNMTWACSIGALVQYGGISCGTCATPPCPECLNDPCSLIATGVYTDENGWCCKDFEKGTVCRPQLSSAAFLKTGNGYDQCGTNFTWSTGYQAVGDCYPITCPDGFEWGSVYKYAYGCFNSTTQMGCYRANRTYDCYTSGKTLCGSGCKNADGSGGCSNYQQEACAPLDEETGKRLCIYGKPVTETCLCDTDKTLTVGALCCAPGQQNVNGTCSVISG